MNSHGGSPTEETAPMSAGPRSSITGGFSQPMPSGAPPPIPERTTPGVGSIARHGSLSGAGAGDTSDQSSDKTSALGSVGRRDSQTSQSSHASGASKPTPAKTTQQSSVVDEAEDTMKNLRKTFAGIFGDM